jgi:hypothetical protein
VPVKDLTMQNNEDVLDCNSDIGETEWNFCDTGDNVQHDSSSDSDTEGFRKQDTLRQD